MKMYSVNAAAAELAKVFPGRGWAQVIIGAIRDGKLRGMLNGLPVDRAKDGAIVAAVVCEVRADDLNTWLEFIGNDYRFDETPASPHEVPAASAGSSDSEEMKDSGGKQGWKAEALKRADGIGRRLRANGVRGEISRPMVARILANEFRKEGIVGAKGELEEASIAKHGLKGWSFKESSTANAGSTEKTTGTSGTSGTSKDS